jgi:hypothetical protein
MSTTSSSPKRLARIAGLLFLAVIVLRGIPLLVARPMVHIPGDPAATAEAVAANQTWLRVGFVSELAGIVAFILLVMVLYRLLRHVDRHIAAAMVTFAAIAVAIASANMITYLAGVVIAADPTLASALGVQGSEGLMLLFLELHEIGYSIAEIFIGLWLFSLGYMTWKSGWFPRPLAVLLMVGCFAYLTLAFTTPLFTRFPEKLLLIAAPAALAQFWMTGYLVTRGVNTDDWPLPTPTPA